MLSVSVSLGGSPAQVKDGFAAMMTDAKTQNEGAAVIDAAAEFVAQQLAGIAADQTAHVSVHLFVRVENAPAQA